jgi:vacuolar-type H+-ATPase subunit D/Vma8
MDYKKYREELVEDLFEILTKIASFEAKEGKQIVSDEALMHIGYAMEHISEIFGVVDEEIEKWRPGYFKKKNN